MNAVHVALSYEYLGLRMSRWVFAIARGLSLFLSRLSKHLVIIDSLAENGPSIDSLSLTTNNDVWTMISRVLIYPLLMLDIQQ